MLLFGGGLVHSVHISMHICVGVFTAEEEGCLHSFSCKHQGERQRRKKRTRRRICPKPKSFSFKEFLKNFFGLDTEEKKDYLRCETFLSDWEVCKHRCGVNHSHVFLLCTQQ